MSNKDLKIAIKGGALLEIWATEQEAARFFRQFSDHIADPASQELIGGTYANGAGDLRLLAYQVAGLASTDR